MAIKWLSAYKNEYFITGVNKEVELVKYLPINVYLNLKPHSKHTYQEIQYLWMETRGSHQHWQSVTLTKLCILCTVCKKLEIKSLYWEIVSFFIYIEKCVFTKLSWVLWNSHFPKSIFSTMQEGINPWICTFFLSNWIIKLNLLKAYQLSS